MMTQNTNDLLQEMPRGVRKLDKLFFTSLSEHSLNCRLALAQGWVEGSNAGGDTYWRSGRDGMYNGLYSPSRDSKHYYHPCGSLKLVMKALKELGKKYRLVLKSEAVVSTPEVEDVGYPEVTAITTITVWPDWDGAGLVESFPGADPATYVRAILWAIEQADTVTRKEA